MKTFFGFFFDRASERDLSLSLRDLSLHYSVERFSVRSRSFLSLGSSIHVHQQWCFEASQKKKEKRRRRGCLSFFLFESLLENLLDLFDRQKKTQTQTPPTLHPSNSNSYSPSSPPGASPSGSRTAPREARTRPTLSGEGRCVPSSSAPERRCRSRCSLRGGPRASPPRSGKGTCRARRTWGGRCRGRGAGSFQKQNQRRKKGRNRCQAS